MAETRIARSPRTPWFLPYVEAGARGSIADGDIFCNPATCTHCDTARTIRYADLREVLASA